jgi:O-antigen/teichoic acid export membrane protein
MGNARDRTRVNSPPASVAPLGRSVLIAVANAGWTAVIGLVAVPFYLHFLGIGNYGLIGFFAMAQALLQPLDLGLAAATNRELARCSGNHAMAGARTLLHTVSRLYWIASVLIALAVFVSAGFIADHWLPGDAGGSARIRDAIALMGLVMACRWPIGLLQPALFGLDRSAAASTVNLIMVSLGSFGAVAVLAWVSPTIEAFFLWQAMVACAHVLVLHLLVWRVVGRGGRPTFDVSALRRIWRYSAGMTGIAVAAMLLVQTDKLVLSRMLDLADFGRYALAGLVAGSLFLLVTPVFAVVTPRMMALVARGDTNGATDLYRLATQLLASVLLPLALSVAFFAGDLLVVWTHDAALAARVAPLVSLLVLGTALNGLMHLPYGLQLAHGRTGLALFVTVSLTVGFVPLIVVLTRRFGATGAAGAWLALNAVYLLFGSWMTHRALCQGRSMLWLLRAVALPLLISTLVIATGWLLVHQASGSLGRVLIAVVLGLCAVIANFVTLPNAWLETVRHKQAPSD